MHIVDRNDEWLLFGERAQRGEQCDSDGVRIRRWAFVVVENECPGECPPLAGGERGQGLVENRVEQIADPREAESRLALGRQRLQHAKPRLLRFGDTCSPNRRLPHSGLAFENECRRSLVDPGDEVAERSKLSLPSDDSGHDSPIVRS